MNFNRYLLGMITTLSVCLGQSDESIFSAATWRAALRFVVEVPAATIATNATSQGSSVSRSIRNILTRDGVFGFYKAIPVEIGRSALWYPRMGIMQESKEVSTQYKPLVQSVGVAIIEAASMPLFRARTALMVESREKFFHEILSVLKTAYTGTGLRFVATWFSWGVYFKTDSLTKEHLKDNPFLAASFIGCSQAGAAVLTAPIYVVLINRQKLTDPCELPFFEALGQHYKRHGLPIFYRTAKLGAVHLVLQAALTNFVMHMFEGKKKH